MILDVLEKGHLAVATQNVVETEKTSRCCEKVALGKEKLAVVTKKMFNNSMSKNHVSSFQISPFFFVFAACGSSISTRIRWQTI